MNDTAIKQYFLKKKNNIFYFTKHVLKSTYLLHRQLYTLKALCKYSNNKNSLNVTVSLKYNLKTFI